MCDCTVVVIDEMTVGKLMKPAVALPRVDPYSMLYLIFTSGTTGKPKGVVISHANFSSGLYHQHAIHGFRSSSRVLDFASYAFDVAYTNLLNTLTNGACLCIPSEQVRTSLSLLSDYITFNHINHADLTPSMASALPLHTLKGLDLLIVGGEALPLDQAKLWSSHVTLMQTYGPAECTVTATLVEIKGEEHAGYLGATCGLNSWIVQDSEQDPSTHEPSLASVGSIGELWLEGPLVGRGYFGDPDKTAAAFVQDPSWLLRGPPAMSDSPSASGRHGRLYRTGDLVHYNRDGTITFVSRRDTQVKIRGQRVELSNIEQNARLCLLPLGLDIQVIAEAIKPMRSANKILILALQLDPLTQHLGESTKQKASLAVATLERRLADKLPGYEVPFEYVVIDTIPVTTTGKVDRRRLREMFEAYTIRQLTALNPRHSMSPRRQPSTDVEHSIAVLWAEVLHVDENEIAVDDSFLKMGGDSLSAMTLVALARKRSNLSFTSADVLKHPQLNELAQIATHRASDLSAPVVEPFSMLASPEPFRDILDSTARQCGVSEHQIEDIFPCTPLQEGLLALTAKNAGDYITHWALDLRATTDSARLQRAWRRVVAALPILRTRVIDLPRQGLVQVVTEEQACTDATSLVRIGSPVEDDLKDTSTPRKPHMGLGTQLVRSQLRSTRNGSSFIVIIHHALYDGWSISLLFDLLEQAYSGEAELPRPPAFQNFVKHILSTDPNEAAIFWSNQLRDLTAPVFPSLPSPGYQVRVNRSLRRSVAIEWPQMNATYSTVIWAAWAFVIAQFSGSRDVVFGVTLSGRQTEATVPGIDHMVGPTIATVPVRLQLDYSNSVSDMLSGVQAQAADIIRYEQTGLQNIRQGLPPETRQAGEFQSLVVVQPKVHDIQLCSELFVQSVNEIEDQDDTVGSSDTYSLNLICTLRDGGVGLELNYDDIVIDDLQAERILSQMKHTLEELCAPINVRADRKISNIEPIQVEDARQIWIWNKTVPIASAQPIHHLIAETVWRQPTAMAVCAWDGDWTYHELDMLSTRLAWLLVQAGVGVKPDMVVPLFFQKTRWMPIAMLAVMKAGGASVAIDVTQPEERQALIVGTVTPKVVLASASMASLAARICSCRVIVADGNLDDPNASTALPLVECSNLLYLIFTSGTTGNPKGVMVTHSNLSSALYHQKHFYRYDSMARVFDYSSYAFDAAWLNFVIATIAGACLCIPSDHDRQNDVAGSIARFQATHADLTASVAKSLPDDTIRSLDVLILGGEALRSQDVDRWAEMTVVVNMYGPSECSPSATIATIDDMRSFPGSIGRGYGLNTWIADPENIQSLVPIGCVGELLLEGPLVGPGYLHDEAKTLAAFVENPDWLVRGSGRETPGRHGRLYRTGDLVRYNPDGTLIFIGRSDTQLKINGQRVEPSEIEEVLKRAVAEFLATSIAVEMIMPVDTSKAMLVAFFDIGNVPAATCADDDAREKMGALSLIVREVVTKQLPRYMIPSALLLVRGFPMTITRKTDRRRLRKTVEGMTIRQIVALDPLRQERQELSTDQEHAVATLWSLVLKISKDDIAANDSFLQLGGDSITAMRLVARTSEYGLSFTVADVLKHPRLRELSNIATRCSAVADQEFHIEPFSLLSHWYNREEVLTTISSLIGVAAAQIEDVFPCTPLQEGFLALGARSSGKGDYIARYDLVLRDTVDIQRFQCAWETVHAQLPILRTRIVDLYGRGLVQIVVKERPVWTDGSAAADTEIDPLIEDMGLCTPLVRFSLLCHSMSSTTSFALCIHHALYDGWSLPLVFETLQRTYQDLTASTSLSVHRIEATDLLSPPFQRFVKYTLDIDSTKAKTFWTQQFDGLAAPIFPALTNLSPEYQLRPNRTVNHDLTIEWGQSQADATASTMLMAAWALVTMQYTSSSDVIFGITLSGRQAAVPQIEQIVGPTLATIPLRVQIDSDKKVLHFLSELQAQILDVGQFEQTGLQRIRKISLESEQACQFQSIVVVQPEERAQLGDDLFVDAFEVEDESTSLGSFDSYAMNLVCSLRGRGVRLCLIYDDNIIDSHRAERLMGQLAHILQQLASPQNLQRALNEISTPQLDHLQQIWSWNADVPETISEPVHNIFAKMVQMYPLAPAVDAWDGHLTYSELDWLSTQLAYKLISSGVERDSIVPLCFEKSMYTTICMLAVMKAGGASVVFDVVGQPEERLRTMIKVVDPVISLCSSAQEELVRHISGDSISTLVVNREMIVGLYVPEADAVLPEVDPASTLYIVFTSGTTGVPKGVTITHSNFSSAIYHQRVSLGRTTSSRVSDFASYAFDASWNNVLHTLANGGCLCVPSEDARTVGLAEHIEQQRVNDIDITPSVASTLPMTTLRKLETMLVGGESLSSDYAALWRDITKLKNVYGPAECTPTATVWDVGKEATLPNCLGRGFGLNTWVVHGDADSQLAPIGSVGELWLEGPLVGRGYLGDEQKTREAFVHDPSWLLQGDSTTPGRRGRLYKTGDLVYYNANGTITFVSRKDSQVKIRGQRVELGDVEHNARQCLEKYPDVHIIAEAARPRNSKNSILVLFLCSGSSARRNTAAAAKDMIDPNGDEILVATLENQLPTLLPSYAVPSLYVHVLKIPIGPTGKADRKTLRGLVESLAPDDLNRFVPSRLPLRAPSSTIGRQLQRLWADTLGVPSERIGCDDNYMRIGGDSIKVMILVRNIKQTFSINMGVDGFLRNRTLDSLSEEVSSLVTGADERGVDTDPLVKDVQDLVKRLQMVPRCTAADAQPFPRTVFLTGGTGYLGTIVLYQLLCNVAVEKVFVLVRASSVELGWQRIMDAGIRAKWWNEQYRQRICIWLGDLRKPCLGLDESHWMNLAGTSDPSQCIEGIVHNGAAVDWLGTYESLRAVNLMSTYELLQVARVSPYMGRFIFVSSSPDLDLERARCSEELLRNELSVAGGYAQTKLMAEYMLLQAVSQKAVLASRICVLKPGFIIGDTPSGIANVDDYIWRIVAASVTLGFFPVEQPDSWIHLATCIDLASLTVENLSITGHDRALTCNVMDGLDPTRFWNAVNSALPVPLKKTPVTSWRNELQARVNDLGPHHPICAVQAFLDDESDAILSAPRTERDAHLDVQRMSRIEAAVACNVRYLLHIGYLSQKEPFQWADGAFTRGADRTK
ncbi:MAG: NRPS [Chrysothrix sp. TS-e1954]|nr:MAG: NRPS [Chrysothrix sp. TS-e1954]